MTKKCLQSFIAYAALSAICLFGMHIMLLLNVNKYIGVSIGGGILVPALIFFIVFFRKKKNSPLVLIFLPINAIGCGLAFSSLYVYLGETPEIVYSLCIWGCYIALFLAYCLLTHIPLFKRFPRICLMVYGLLILAGVIVGICLSSTVVFALALMMFILFTSFLATIAVPSADRNEHNKILALFSFIGLFFVVIVVLVVISEGDGLDGLDIFSDGRVNKDRKINPYDFKPNL